MTRDVDPPLGGRLDRLGSRPTPPSRRPRRRDLGRGGAEPLREAARRNPSAIGERQMLPVQTTRMDVMGPRVYPGPSSLRAVGDRAAPRRSARSDTRPGAEHGRHVRARGRRRSTPSPTSGSAAHRYTATASPNVAWSSSHVDRGGLAAAVRARDRQRSGPREDREGEGMRGTRTPIVGGSPPRSHARRRRSAAARASAARARSAAARPPRARRRSRSAAPPPSRARAPAAELARASLGLEQPRGRGGSSGRVPMP